MTSVPPGKGQNIKGSQTDGRRTHTKTDRHKDKHADRHKGKHAGTYTDTGRGREERQTQIEKNEVEVHKKIDTRGR